MSGGLIGNLIGGHAGERSDLYDPRRLASVIREGGSFLKEQAHVAQRFVGDRLPPLTGPALEDPAQRQSRGADGRPAASRKSCR
ncbi:hypothetical protein ACFWP7_32175 [Streptomyces sp. NPDC058470]|uniref:hypothetical protein n=1 Tax=Streptomyces sp. NPDC058470 TaxID=3346515 RepID=UPI00365235EB